MYSFKILSFQEVVIEIPVIIHKDWVRLKGELSGLDPKPAMLELSGPFRPCYGKRGGRRRRRVWWERYARVLLTVCEWLF